MLYGTNYNKHYLSKYGNPKIKKPLTSGQIAHYGLQILQALKFLRDKDIPHGHLHPGNIVIENQKALLLDIENSIFGAPSLYRPQILELKRVNTSEAVDVYSFGCTLYEMTFAAPLENSTCDEFPTEISEDLESVLRLCLSSESLKHKLPSIEYLLSHPFFTRSRALTNGLASHEECRIHLKFPLSLKENLRRAIVEMEERLKSDQKSVRYAKREMRIQEILSSEEEMRKQKRRLKKRDSVWKSTSSLTDPRSCSASTASSPTPPHIPAEKCESEGRSDTAVTSAPSPLPQAGRTALLSAICAFDKSKLTRVQ
ncbi:PX domain-containing protein kinase-like protein [Eumeta japonica]|uniref:PX domain-containing protein kinase-like protein n=1 Tax=Eumeta variegata TaxID=151549 RepID=A0A4C1WZC2_EUMVA|nr:PX domain-containing protein kinase-like protein [Eumeta japonica]